MSTNEKLLKAISQHMGDFRCNEVILAHDISREPYEVQARFLNTALAYIHAHVKSYQAGLIRGDVYDIVLACIDVYENGMSSYCPPDNTVGAGRNEFFTP